MSEHDDGGPAFPSGLVSVGDGDSQAYTAGMSLRDWFAGQAMISYSAHPNSEDWEYDSVARSAYAQADAMMRAREVKP